MSVVSSICFFISFLVVLSCFRRGADPFSPGRVFLMIWSVAIGLADLKLSYFQTEWSFYAWVTLFVGLGAFWLGLFLSATENILMPLQPIATSRRFFSEILVHKRRLFQIILVLFVLYILCYIAEAILEGGIPILSSRPDVARVQFGVFGLHLIVSTMPTILFLIVEYFVLVKKNMRKKIALATIFFVTAVTFFGILHRFPFVGWALMSLAFVYYSSIHFRLRRVVFGALAFFGALAAIQTLRLVAYVRDYIYVVSRMKFSQEYAIFAEPYMYIVMNLENFARAVDRLEQFSYGYFTGDFIMALVGLKHVLADYFNLQERPFIISGYNTFPFLWQYYYDFGLIGMGILSLLLGLTIGITYHRMRSRPTLINTVLYAFFFYVMVISFFTNPLTMLNTIFNIVVLLGIQYAITVKDSVSSQWKIWR